MHFIAYYVQETPQRYLFINIILVTKQTINICKTFSTLNWRQMSTNLQRQFLSLASKTGNRSGDFWLSSMLFLISEIFVLTFQKLAIFLSQTVFAVYNVYAGIMSCEVMWTRMRACEIVYVGIIACEIMLVRIMTCGTVYIGIMTCGIVYVRLWIVYLRNISCKTMYVTIMTYRTVYVGIMVFGIVYVGISSCGNWSVGNVAWDGQGSTAMLVKGKKWKGKKGREWSLPEWRGGCWSEKGGRRRVFIRKRNDRMVFTGKRRNTRQAKCDGNL